MAVCCLVFSGEEGWAAEGESCSKALKQIADRGFQEEAITTNGAGVCPDDTLSYVSFVGFVLTSKGELSERDLQSGLLKSAEDGYLSARIIYTLIFDMFASRFGDDFFVKQDYSRYAPYIASLRFFGDWRQDRVVDKFFIASEFANEAVRRGVIEANLLKHLFNQVQYKSDKNEASKRDAAVSLLILASFLNKTDVARQYLVGILGLHRAELYVFEADSKSIVARMLNDSENSVCGQEKECVLGLNIKRVICDIRDRNGVLLYRVEEQNCNRLSEPLLRLYRQFVADAFDSFISGMKP